MAFNNYGYDPIQFSLTKMSGTSSKGWALFGIFSCIFFVISTLFCCGGFIYKTQVSGGGGYMRANDFNGAYASQALWTREPVSDAGSSRKSERRYGT
ncbi:hypothetical protein Hdeb2414_s0006g00204511 [Helianthus debilis subsp. tardiflorus]